MLNDNSSNLDIESNRRQQKYKLNILVLRALWGLARPLFRFSPRTSFGYRNTLLRFFGAKIGKHVHIYNSAIIYMPWNLEIGDWSSIGEWALLYNLAPVRIGTRVTVSYRAHICCGTHDYSKSDLPLDKQPVTIYNDGWICADAFIGPGLQIHEGAIVGARSVVLKDVQSWTIVAGNPAKVIKTRRIEKG